MGFGGMCWEALVIVIETFCKSISPFLFNNKKTITVDILLIQDRIKSKISGCEQLFDRELLKEFGWETTDAEWNGCKWFVHKEYGSFLDRNPEGSKTVDIMELDYFFRPCVELSNGLRVANWSSNHWFTFEDGTRLPPCRKQRSEDLGLDMKEYATISECGRYHNLKLQVDLSTAAYNDLMYTCVSAAQMNMDIVIVPFRVLELLKKLFVTSRNVPFRTIKHTNRTDKICHIDKFCI